MTGQPPLWRRGAAELHAAYRAGTLTPAQVASAALDHIDRTDPTLNTLVHVRRDGFLADAQASTLRFTQGRPAGDLDGIPLSIKDNLLTVDMPTTWGCEALRDHLDPRDEVAVARARGAGALIVGKTNVPEFTLEGYTANRLHGTTRNPWNPALTPGGSSGGAVAGIAAGLFPLALGTDGGGSIRRPASHCGVVGLKPSIGAIPREATLPPLLLDFEVIGPMARTVEDVRLLFHAVRGPVAADRRSLGAAHAAAGGATEARGLRILYVPTLGNAPVDAQVAASVQQAAAHLHALGHVVDQGPLPLDLDFFSEMWPQVGQIGLAAMYSAFPGWRAASSPKYQAMATTGAGLPAARLWEIIERVETLRRDCSVLFRRFDLVVTPAAAALPWPADEAFPSVIHGEPVGPRGHAIFTGWVNACGHPAIALPCRPSAEGLPIGMQIIGNYGADDLLLAVAADYERAHPWHDRWPATA
jgi:aspartyl-tRNA(Asn)/glutamyl-tRNA(Gln) amidotransferase subunit A